MGTMCHNWDEAILSRPLAWGKSAWITKCNLVSSLGIRAALSHLIYSLIFADQPDSGVLICGPQRRSIIEFNVHDSVRSSVSPRWWVLHIGSDRPRLCQRQLLCRTWSPYFPTKTTIARPQTMACIVMRRQGIQALVNHMSKDGPEARSWVIYSSHEYPSSLPVSWRHSFPEITERIHRKHSVTLMPYCWICTNWAENTSGHGNWPLYSVIAAYIVDSHISYTRNILPVTEPRALFAVMRSIMEHSLFGGKLNTNI